MWHETLKNAARGPTAAEDGRNDKKYERGTCRIRKRCGTSGAPQGYSTVGCGCFVNVERISELPFIEYAIITSSKVFQKEFDARKYLVQFKKLDSKLKTFELDSALFSHGQILQDPASGLTVIPLNPKSTVFSHQLQFAPASKTCSVLKNNHFEVEYVYGFLKYFNALCCHMVADDPSNDRSFGVITQELTQNSSGQCILSSLPWPRVALGAAIVKRDKKKWSLVGVLNSDSCVPENFRPLWLSRGKFENLRWVKAIPAESNHSVNGGGDAGSTSGGGDGTNGGEDSGSDAGGTNVGNDGGGDSTNGGEGDDDDTSGGDDGDGTNDGNDAGGDAISANGSGHATSANGGGDSDCGNGDADGTNGTGHVEGASGGGDANNGDVVGGDDVNNGCGGGPPGDSDRSKDNDGDNNKNDVYDSYSRDFKATLEHLKQAAEQGFKNLQRVSTNLMKNLPALELAEDNYLNEVDWECQELIPTSKSTVYRALKTTSDGNCFFRAASILAFRDENRHEEMRVRIVVELSVNDKFYLKGKDLCRRIEAQAKEIYPRSKNITSEMNPEVIKEVFEEEVLDTARSASWASYWHLPALGAVLNRLVQSVYPECGGSEVRKYFNALICPRLLDPEKEPVTIMWTRTGASGGDGTHFRPNHFVPLVSVDKMMPFPVDEFQSFRGASPTETSYISLMHATTLKDENSPDSSKDLFSQMKEGVRRSNSLSLSGLTRKEEHQKIPHCESFPLLKQVQSEKGFSSDCATNGDHSANSSKSLKGMVVNLPPENAKEALMAPSSRIIPQDQLSCQPTANSGALLQGPNNNPPAARSRDHSILPKNHSCPSDLAKMEELPKVKRSASELLPRPPEGKQKFYPSDLLAKTILGCLELLEGLCRCLDKEYTYGTSKCWKHIAEAFGIKEQDYQNFKCSQFHSPTEVMFEYLKTCSPEVKVGHVKDGLSSIERQDVIAVFVKYEQLYQTLNDETLMCSLFDSHPDIIGEIAFLLDMQKAGLKNWSHLAAKLDIPRDVFKSFETFSADNPAERLFEIIKIRFPRSTIGELIGHLQAMKRLDVVNAIKESAEVTDDSLISDLMEDLDVTYRVCELLNQQLRTSKVLGWKHLGKRFGFNKATLDDLSPTQEEIISPTEALIRHLGGSMPWLSIENFIWALHNNDRNDALAVLHVYLPDGCIPNILKSCDCQRCQMSRQEENTRLQWH